MRKSQLRVVFISLLIICMPFFGCKKEYVTTLTHAEEIANQLQAEISARGVKRILILTKTNPTFTDPLPTDIGTNWTFKNGFIMVSGYSIGGTANYNLDYLLKYDFTTIKLTDGTSPLHMILTFYN